MKKQEIEKWISALLVNEFKLNIIDDIALFEQLDSFEVVSLLAACDDKFENNEWLSNGELAGLCIGELATLISDEISGLSNC